MSGGSPDYEIVGGGVAIIRAIGEFTRRGDPLVAYGYQTWDGLQARLAGAGRDRRVLGVALEIDSAGGSFAGSTETAAVVRELSTTKPVVAFVNGLATGESYALAAAAEEIVVAPSATLGDIGMAMLHLDRSGQLAKGGIKTTFVFAGARKVDGASVQPLSNVARTHLQARLDDQRELLVESIGKHRPALGTAGARKTQAARYMGQTAVAAKLADRVGTIDTAVDLVRQRIAARRPAPRPSAAAASRPEGSSFRVAAGDSKFDSLPPASPRSIAPAAVTTADPERIIAILQTPEAKERPRFAQHLAFETNLDAASATAVLSLASVEHKRPRGRGASAQVTRVYRSMADANAAIARKEGGFTLDLSAPDPEVLDPEVET